MLYQTPLVFPDHSNNGAELRRARRKSTTAYLHGIEAIAKVAQARNDVARSKCQHWFYQVFRVKVFDPCILFLVQALYKYTVSVVVWEAK